MELSPQAKLAAIEREAKKIGARLECRVEGCGCVRGYEQPVYGLVYKDNWYPLILPESYIFSDTRRLQQWIKVNILHL
ncbi:hypothetical protein EI42_02196 [Thermosporothrix hazakensis]|uniref:Uncharacterized protein n=1 Tax=Thermosporothrix hazakensis TaxID=644383 RepID=A0A326U7E4_THEHA|nr:hypothetical protein EI42_02196 [Thermosporothrix hazakensis]